MADGGHSAGCGGRRVYFVGLQRLCDDNCVDNGYDDGGDGNDGEDDGDDE